MIQYINHFVAHHAFVRDIEMLQRRSKLCESNKAATMHTSQSSFLVLSLSSNHSVYLQCRRKLGSCFVRCPLTPQSLIRTNISILPEHYRPERYCPIMDPLWSPTYLDNTSTPKPAVNDAAIDPALQDADGTMSISPTIMASYEAVINSYPQTDYQVDPLEAAGEFYSTQSGTAPAPQPNTSDKNLNTFSFAASDCANSQTMTSNQYDALDPSQAHNAPNPWSFAEKTSMNQSSYDLGGMSLSEVQYFDFPPHETPAPYVSSKTREPSFGVDFEERRPSADLRGRRRHTTHRPAPMKIPSSSSRRSPTLFVSPKASSRDRKSSDDSDAPRARQQSLYKKERPKKDREHDWVRTNKTTQGLTSRTGKINAYDPVRDGGYKLTPHPIGTWTGALTGKEFMYTENGELMERVFTAEEVNDFLYSHANNAGSSLTLWIQRAPADCARRYPTRGSDKCLFAECPFKYEHRNILVGHIRVAFDEQWNHYKYTRDPFFVAAYCHLYCLERFCDLPAIARDLHIKPDNRPFRQEPRGVWAASLGDTSMKEIAEGFIKNCKRGTIRQNYPMYPFIATQQFPDGRDPHDVFNPYTSTLTFALTDAKTRETNSSKRATMESRGLGPSNMLVHKGDLQMIIEGKMKTKRRKKSMVQKEVKKHVERRMQKYAADQAEADAQHDAQADTSDDDDAPPPPRQGTKRKAAAEARKRTREISNDDAMDVSSEDEYRPESHPNKRRKNADPSVAPKAVMYDARPTPTLPSQTAPTPTTAKLTPTFSRHGALMDSLYDFSLADYEVAEPAKQGEEAASRKDDLMGSMFGF